MTDPTPEIDQVLLQIPNHPEAVLQCRAVWHLTDLIEAVKEYIQDKTNDPDNARVGGNFTPLRPPALSQQQLEKIDELMTVSFEPITLDASWVRFWGTRLKPLELAVNGLEVRVRLLNVLITENLLDNATAKVTAKFHEIVIDDVGFNLVDEGITYPEGLNLVDSMRSRLFPEKS